MASQSLSWPITCDRSIGHNIWMWPFVGSVLLGSTASWSFMENDVITMGADPGRVIVADGVLMRFMWNEAADGDPGGRDVEAVEVIDPEVATLLILVYGSVLKTLLSRGVWLWTNHQNNEFLRRLTYNVQYTGTTVSRLCYLCTLYVL